MFEPQYQLLLEPLKQLVIRITDDPNINLISIEQAEKPQQGESGGNVNAYTVGYTTTSADVIHTLQVVDKQATLLERCVVNLLMEQEQAIPPAYIQDIESDSRQPIYMQVANSRPMQDVSGDIYRPMTAKIATGLARIHAANRTKCPDWLPKVADNYMRELYLEETQIVWDRCMQDNRFYAEFGIYDKGLKTALEQFLKLMIHLTDEGDTLTLLNSDLHPDHIRLLTDDQPVFIDWEQACYGSLYLDLVNYFSIETVLLYRDALADAGYEIPTAAFIERFREVGHFMGLRYFEVGLRSWEAGGEQWQQGRWFFHYCLTMALRGR